MKRALLVLTLVFVSLVLLPSLGTGQGPTERDRPTDRDRMPPDRARRPKVTDRARHAGMGRDLSPEEVDEMISIVREMHPEAAERLKRAKTEHPKHVGLMIQRRFPRSGSLLELKRRDPEMYELEVKNIRLGFRSNRLGKAYRDAMANGESEKVEEISGQLEQTVKRHFEVRQEVRERQLVKLKAQIEKLEAELAKRVETREKLISERAEQLKGESEKARW